MNIEAGPLLFQWSQSAIVVMLHNFSMPVDGIKYPYKRLRCSCGEGGGGGIHQANHKNIPTQRFKIKLTHFSVIKGLKHMRSGLAL